MNNSGFYTPSFTKRPASSKFIKFLKLTQKRYINNGQKGLKMIQISCCLQTSKLLEKKCHFIQIITLIFDCRFNSSNN